MVSNKEFDEVFEEFIGGAINEEKEKRYTCAIELYYKAFLKICDKIILDEKGIIVENHSHRNDILSELNGDLNSLKDELHLIYRGTYKSKKDSLDCKKFKDAIKTTISLRGIKDRIKEISEKIQ